MGMRDFSPLDSTRGCTIDQGDPGTPVPYRKELEPEFGLLGCPFDKRADRRGRTRECVLVEPGRESWQNERHQLLPEKGLWVQGRFKREEQLQDNPQRLSGKGVDHLQKGREICLPYLHQQQTVHARIVVCESASEQFLEGRVCRIIRDDDRYIRKGV